MSLLILENKLLLCKSIICLIWPYGCELWGCAHIFNIPHMKEVRKQDKKYHILAGHLNADMNPFKEKPCFRDWRRNGQNTYLNCKEVMSMGISQAMFYIR